MIKRINIILLILIALAGPASAATVVFSLVSYFGNISDQPNAFRETQGVTGLKSTCDIPNEQIRTYISNAAQYTRVSAAFIAATAKQESGFNPKAQSDYAGGVMQLANQQSYDTFDEMAGKYRKDYEDNFAGFKAGTTIKPPGQAAPTAITGKRATDIYIAEYNIFLGAKYQKELFDLYKKRAKEEKLLELVAAAYNGGPGALEDAKFDYTKMDKQTQDYVPKVLANYRDYKARCEEDLTVTTAKSEHGSAIANRARELVGTGSACYNADVNNACAAFTSEVVNPIAGTHLDNLVPVNWSSNEGMRITDPSQLEPGDLVYWSGSLTYQPGDNSPDNPSFFKPGDVIPSHVGIYVGSYSGPDGKQNGQTVNYSDAVIHNSGSNASIIVTPIGVRTFFGAKRY